MAEILFWFISLFTIVSAFFVVLNNQLLYSAIALLFTLFGIAGLYVFLWADFIAGVQLLVYIGCLLYTSPSPRDRTRSRMPSSA